MGRWVYPPLDEVMMTVGIDEAGKYVICRQNTEAHYIPTWPILDLCLALKQRPGSQVMMIWW